MFHSDFWLFELSVWLHVFALSLVNVFIPILLLEAGYSIETVILYYVVYNAIDVPLNFLARRLVRSIGARLVIVAGTVFAVLFFLALEQVTSGGIAMLFVLASLAALYDAFYWVAHLYLFIESDKKNKDAGKSTGIIYSVRKFAGFMGPALGAGLLIFWSSEALIVASVFFFILSLVPLIKVDEFPDKPAPSRLSFKGFFSTWEERKNYALTSLFSLHSAAEGVLWPLFIFVVFGTIESVAIVPIIVSVTTIVFSYLAGRIARSERDRIIGMGAFLIALVWILRITLEGSFFLYASIFLVGFFSLFVSIPIDSNVFTRAKETDALNASTYRNTFHMFIKFIFYGILGLMVSIFEVSFIIAALSMFILIAIDYLFVSKLSKRALS